MAQLRRDYERFTERDAVIWVVGPDDQKAFQNYWEKEDLPFIGLPDPKHTVARLYGQQVRWLKLGRMPALVVIDKGGRVHYRHYGASMSDIPPNDKILALLESLNQSS
jgi:peroxiredoxin